MLLGQAEGISLEIFIAQKQMSSGTLVRPWEVSLDK